MGFEPWTVQPVTQTSFHLNTPSKIISSVTNETSSMVTRFKIWKPFSFRLYFEAMQTSYSLSQPGNVNLTASLNSAHSRLPHFPSAWVLTINGCLQTDWPTKLQHPLALAPRLWLYMVCFADRNARTALSSLCNAHLQLFNVSFWHFYLIGTHYTQLLCIPANHVPKLRGRWRSSW